MRYKNPFKQALLVLMFIIGMSLLLDSCKVVDSISSTGYDTTWVVRYDTSYILSPEGDTLHYIVEKSHEGRRSEHKIPMSWGMILIGAAVVSLTVLQALK